MFGDILSDLAAQMIGGLGFASAGNIGDEFAVFEPTHGSAPKYTGKAIVNPIASIEAVRMMLEHLGEEEAAQDIERAISNHIASGKIKTADMGGNNKTHEVGDSIERILSQS